MLTIERQVTVTKQPPESPPLEIPRVNGLTDQQYDLICTGIETQAIDLLKPKYQQLIRDYMLNDLTYQDLADEKGVEIPSISVMFKKAIGGLRDKVKDKLNLTEREFDRRFPVEETVKGKMPNRPPNKNNNGRERPDLEENKIVVTRSDKKLWEEMCANGGIILRKALEYKILTAEDISEGYKIFGEGQRMGRLDLVEKLSYAAAVVVARTEDIRDLGLSWD